MALVTPNCCLASVGLWKDCCSLQDVRVFIDWTRHEVFFSRSSSNVLELLAVKDSMLNCNGYLRMRCLLALCGHMTAVGCANDMSGHGSVVCDGVACEI